MFYKLNYLGSIKSKGRKTNRKPTKFGIFSQTEYYEMSKSRSIKLKYYLEDNTHAVSNLLMHLIISLV
jgi:hypothetical protein